MAKPKWLKQESDKKKSQKQEKKLAKVLKGKLTLNSGALFQKNDVLTKNFSIEAKTTKYNSYSLKLKDIKLVEKYALRQKKFPLFVIDFLDKETYGVISLGDLLYIMEKANLL